MTTLQGLRERIDRLDDRLLTLLNRRADLSVRVGRIKREKGLPVVNRSREAGVLSRLVRESRGPLTAASVRTIFRTIFRQSRKLQSSGRHSRKD
ncbi:MAG: chorismate mutase [Candidatus Omnitrophica bacterium CG11_big_fil_rev_8_21_14_0_20_64_10]|nr:MAG: chorismate mutase [Candidatus Omnitrophica bacterium CG11_big_fil_rev_8_21_14_0_20_64_10]